LKENKRMKEKKIILIATIVGIGIFIYIYWIRADYNWAEKTIYRETKSDWQLISKLKSKIFLKPWTWFKEPVTQLVFIKKKDLARMDSITMVGHIYLTSILDEESEGYEYYEIFNCLENKSIIIQDLKDVKTLDLSKIDWSKEKKILSKENLFKYYCEKNKKYIMIDYRGREIDISNYIISGEYSLLNSSKYIDTIKNNYPYLLVQNDEILIKEAISKWYNEKYPNQTIKLPIEIYKNTKYIYSRIGHFGIPDDIYMFEFIPNSFIGKLKIQFYFTRFSIPNEVGIKDEVWIINY